MSANLPLRDVQLPPAPSWWPPAPGYLMIGGVVLLLLRRECEAQTSQSKS